MAQAVCKTQLLHKQFTKIQGELDQKSKKGGPSAYKCKELLPGPLFVYKIYDNVLPQVTELKALHNSRQKLILIAHLYRGAVSVAKTQLNCQLINNFTSDTEVLIRHSQVWFTVVTTDPRRKGFRKKLIKDRMWVLMKCQIVTLKLLILKTTFAYEFYLAMYHYQHLKGAWKDICHKSYLDATLFLTGKFVFHRRILWIESLCL